MSIVSSISNSLVPINKAGYPFIVIFLVISILLGFLWFPLFWIGLVFTTWCIYFFRDPARVTPVNAQFVISPADGKVSFVGCFIPPAELNLGSEEMLRISVFMNVFNCHVNRIPMDGKIEAIHYRRGKFVNAELDKASEQNERNSLVITTAHGKIGVVQVAGLVARRIICWKQSDESVLAGERFGLIRFGSRLDVYLSKNAKPQVGVGQNAIAGETVLAHFDENAAITDFRLA